MKVVIACAGTGGHIIPGIAIANYIKEKDKNNEIIFIGTRTGIENDLVKKAGYDIYSISTGKLLRKITFKNLKGLFNAYKGIDDAKVILEKFKPDICIGTGGYICVPVMMACKKLKIPYALHESNSLPGLSVKLLSRKAKVVMTGFNETIDKLSYKKNAVFTGTPTKVIREEYDALDKNKCKEKLNLPLDKKIVFVTFGSQGAKFLNTKVIDMIANNQSDDILYVLATGKNNYEEVKNYINEISKKSEIKLSNYIKIKSFIYDMTSMYKVADFCITRAGALTVTELAVTRTPSILIPLPYAAENHQYFNAKIVEDINSGYILEEKEFSVDKLSDMLLNTLKDEKLLKKMQKNYDKIYKENVLSKIYDEIIK